MLAANYQSDYSCCWLLRLIPESEFALCFLSSSLAENWVTRSGFRWLGRCLQLQLQALSPSVRPLSFRCLQFLSYLGLVVVRWHDGTMAQSSRG